MSAGCTGEPVSWLALERFALAELDPGAAARVRGHLDACAACRAALARITDDVRVLPPLPRAVQAPRRRWWQRRAWSGGLGLALAAAAALLLLVRKPDEPRDPRTLRWKGGALVLTLVRERAGAVGTVPGPGPADVRPDDRWKLQVTCPPRAGTAWIDVVVVQAGAAPVFPLPAQPIACGNDVVVPGAFRISGGAATVCVAVGDAAPDRALIARQPTRGTACVALAPAPGL